MKNTGVIDIKLKDNALLDIFYKGDIEIKDRKDSLFVKNNGIYVLTDYAKYIIISQAKKVFANLICELDTNQSFHRKSQVEVPDPEVFANTIKLYQDNKKEFEKLLREWKENNLDKFEFVPFIPSIQVYAKDFKFNTEGVTLEDAVQGYKYCNAELKKFDKEKLATSKKITIKPEYKDEYTNVSKTFREITGYPTESEIKASIKETVLETRTRLALDRKPAMNPGATEIFVNSYVKYFIESDFSPKEELEENEE